MRVTNNNETCPRPKSLMQAACVSAHISPELYRKDRAPRLPGETTHHRDARKSTGPVNGLIARCDNGGQFGEPLEFLVIGRLRAAVEQSAAFGAQKSRIARPRRDRGVQDVAMRNAD